MVEKHANNNSTDHLYSTLIIIKVIEKAVSEFSQNKMGWKELSLILVLYLTSRINRGLEQLRS